MGNRYGVGVTSTKLTIGLPVYQGGQDLDRALLSLSAQTFRDWILIVADNASTDETAEIAASHARRDERIRYLRHEQNLGAASNFIFLARMAETPYFMWAAADDEWDDNYVEACIACLQERPDLGFAGGRVVNIDQQGDVVRTYSAFAGYAGPSATVRVWRYVSRREIDGKANMIYSVFRTELIKAACSVELTLKGWGSDMALVVAALERAPYQQISNAALQKRVKLPGDVATAAAIAAGRYNAVDYEGNFPLREFPSYLASLLRATSSFGRWVVVLLVMIGRVFGVAFWRLRKFMGR